MNPLTGVYGGVTALRNTLYEHGVLHARRLRQPVVSVGNLSAGGSGKTPFVIALGELLKARDIHFDVLSRGYRRKTRGVLVVEADGNASDFGEEPLLIARRLGVPVIVGESRYDAGCLAENRFQSQLHILDDGFQHRSLARDFDIVLMTVSDCEDRLLPIGRLREPLSALRRADAIVLPYESSSYSLQEMGLQTFVSDDTLLWSARREISFLEKPADPIAFCGIAKPRQFFAQLRTAGFSPAAEIKFRDHHPYTKRDIARLLAMRTKLGAGGFVTTEKDAINLGPLATALDPIAVAKLTVVLERPTDVVDTILTRIKDRRPHS